MGLFRCGSGGIRTPGTVARTSHFECDPIDHSGTLPGRIYRFSNNAKQDFCLRNDRAWHWLEYQREIILIHCLPAYFPIFFRSAFPPPYNAHHFPQTTCEELHHSPISFPFCEMDSQIEKELIGIPLQSAGIAVWHAWHNFSKYSSIQGLTHPTLFECTAKFVRNVFQLIDKTHFTFFHPLPSSYTSVRKYGEGKR